MFVRALALQKVVHDYRDANVSEERMRPMEANGRERPFREYGRES